MSKLPHAVVKKKKPFPGEEEEDREKAKQKFINNSPIGRMRKEQEEKTKQLNKQRELAVYCPAFMLQISPRKWAVAVKKLLSHYAGSDLIPIPEIGIYQDKLSWEEARTLVATLNREFLRKRQELEDMEEAERWEREQAENERIRGLYGKT